jgi:prophage regulatory protein
MSTNTTGASAPIFLLRKPDVLKRTGISRSSWDRGVRQGRFPKPVQIGKRSVAWTSSSIDAMIAFLGSAV